MFKIPRFRPGSADPNIFDSSYWNNLFDAIEPWLNAVGKNGIKITTSKANSVVEFTGTVSGSSSPTTDNTSTTSSFNPADWFRGQWYANQSYKRGESVRRNQDWEYDLGYVVGGYLCIADVPANAGPACEPTWTDNSYWKLTAPFATQKFVMINNDGNGNISQIYINTRSDNPVGIVMNNNLANRDVGTVDISPADCPSDYVKLNREDICENGQSKSKIFLDSTKST